MKLSQSLFKSILLGIILLFVSRVRCKAEDEFIPIVRNTMVTNSVAVHIKPMYLYSDMDVFRYALQDPQYARYIGWGGVLEFAYSQPIARHTLVRYDASIGYYHGDATELRANPNKGHYNGAFLEGDIGLECYPFQAVGWYLYGGLGVNLNNGTVFPEKKSQRSHHFLPMCAVEVGYKIAAKNGWYVGAAVCGHIGMLDTSWGNMDDYGDYEDSKFPDGYVTFSLLVSYHWARRSKYSRICNCLLWQ